MNFEKYEKLSLDKKKEIIIKRWEKYKFKCGEEMIFDMECFLNIDDELVNECGGDVEQTIDTVAIYY